MPQWNANTVSQNGAPTWDYIKDGFRGTQSNTQVDSRGRGWDVEHEWGAETVVAIGGMFDPSASPEFFAVQSVHNLSGNVQNAVAQSLKVFVQLNLGAKVVDANTANLYIVAISNDANVANVNLVYDPAISVPQSGELYFDVAGVDLSNATPGTTTLTINSSSLFHDANAALQARKPTHSPFMFLPGTALAAINVVISVA